MTDSDAWTLDTLVERYKQHQRRTRGLRDQTLHGYERFVRLFVRGVLGGDPIDPRCITTSKVIEFVVSMRGRFSPLSMKAVRTALRSFFRFLRLQGLCDDRLEAAVPAVAHWRLSMLPRCLSDQQLVKVLTSLDTSTPCGHRNRAIVLCLSTLGLRPREIAELRLEDVDWRAGIVHLRARKNRRGADLPLPCEAGRAIVAYLRKERPATQERRVFVQHAKARRGEPISSHGVTGVVAYALRRANVEAPLASAYVFRHTLASQMVQRGSSLKEVADFLGHRCLDTTTIYAKLDLPALRDVALPWPELAR
ncbi:MAG TPA: tyrosine-type recombinase/integrase [Candidatus Dormibacteraeota bacterium]|nr:tyrosine-type recombinase/integrase [Candidatus Dormibacteraeota bacterium]